MVGISHVMKLGLILSVLFGGLLDVFSKVLNVVFGGWVTLVVASSFIDSDLDTATDFVAFFIHYGLTLCATVFVVAIIIFLYYAARQDLWLSVAFGLGAATCFVLVLLDEGVVNYKVLAVLAVNILYMLSELFAAVSEAEDIDKVIAS